MAYQLAALIQCNDSDKCELIKQFLDRKTRPLFEKDVPADQIDLFKVIEYVEYPDTCERFKEGLWLSWFRVEDFGFPQVQELFEQLNVSAPFVFEVPDNPMSGDSDEDEVSGNCWLWDDGTYVKASRGRIRSVFGTGIIERLP
jgi:hypothetical protein